MTAPADYLPPQNPDAEQAVLGAVLMDPDNIAVLGPMVRPDDFARLENADIWRAMLDLWRKRTPAADILLIDALKSSAAFHAAGGAAYLADLRASSWLGIYGEYYAEIVARLAHKRRLISVLSSLISEAWRPDTDPGDVLAEALRKITATAPESFGNHTYLFSDLSQIVRDELSLMLESDYHRDVVVSGMYDLDRALGGGLERGQLATLGARPSIGKTAFAMQWVKNYARLQATYPDPQFTLVFSAEMTARGLMYRALTEHTHLTTSQLKEPRHLTEDQLIRVDNELDVLAGLPVIINDRSRPSTEYMQGEIERLKARYPIRFVMFDYLGLAGNAHKDEVQRYAQISAGLKGIAKACDVSVLALAQLNRNVEHRPKNEKRPRLSDFNQSGQIEADADIAIGMYRHDYYVEKNMEDYDADLHNVAELIVLKQRDGTTPVVRVQFTPETVSFHSLAKG